MPKVYKSRNNPVCQTRSKALRASINATHKGDLLLFASAISWSPTAYKIFINPLLDTLERNQLGAYLGIHYCGTPTVADDVTLISNDPYELQSMLDIQTSHANSKRYHSLIESERFCFHLTFDATLSYQCLKKSQLSPVMPKVYKSRNKSSVPNHIKGFTSIHKCHV
jgi:hypothetical protein